MNPSKLYIQQPGGAKYYVSKIYWSRKTKGKVIALETSMFETHGLVCADSVIVAVRKLNPKQKYIAAKETANQAK